jgi:hypothetical protein
VPEKCVVASCSSSSFVLRPRFGGEFRGRGRGTRREPNFQTRSKRGREIPGQAPGPWR